MFQFRAFPAYSYLIQSTLTRYCRAGFPHSDISGSTRMCRSPKLFAACHVLHRLLMPRHSPCALISLTNRQKMLSHPPLLWFSKNYAASQKNFYRSNCSCYPIIPHFCAPLPGRLPSVALLLLIIFHCSVFKVQILLRARARMVEISGIEPLTPCLQSRCSTS